MNDAYFLIFKGGFDTGQTGQIDNRTNRKSM
jgi:hypothetical protein